jgi:hypothetical protein
MKKLIFFVLTIFFFSLKPAYNQQAYWLGIQPPPFILIDFYPDDTIYRTGDEIGEEVNLDDLFTVYSQGIEYTRQWKFRQGSLVTVIEDPLITITGNGVFYLTVINDYGCSFYDSIYLYIQTTTNTKDIKYDRGNSQTVRVYPNPNLGTFDITLSECQQGYTVEMINSTGVQLLNQKLECRNNEYSGTIIMPAVRSGIYYVLVKKDNTIIYRKKVIILK